MWFKGVTLKGNKKWHSRTIELKATQIEPLLKYIEDDRPQLVKGDTNDYL